MSKINEKWSGIKEQNVEEEQRNNRYSGFSIAMILSKLRLSVTLNLILFNLSSHEKYQQDLLSVLIPGKRTPASLQEDMFTGWLIMAKNSTAMEKEIISMVWRVSGDT